jgi:hypothetical protein
MLQFLQLSQITVHGVGNRFIFVRTYFSTTFLCHTCLLLLDTKNGPNGGCWGV